MTSIPKARSSLWLVAVAFGLSCGHDTLATAPSLVGAAPPQDASAPGALVGSGGTGGAVVMGGTGGIQNGGGTGGVPTTGFGGSTGLVGSTGRGGMGAMARPSTPLQIPAKDALYRLATFLGNGNIEDLLLKALNDGRPRSVQDVGELTKELLQGLVSRRRIEDFTDWWLELPKLRGVKKADPEFANLVEAFAVEPRNFVAYEILEGEDSWRSLISAPATVFLSVAHARFYGVTTPDPPLLVNFPMLPPNQRAGLLTMPGILALSSLVDRNSISDRGLYVHSHFLCQEFPAHPPGVAKTIPPGSGPNTLRERQMASLNSPACAACHTIIDSTGYLFEGYDTVGRFRTTDNGKPIDTAGRVEGMPLSDPVALARWMAAAPLATRCFTKKWLQFAIGPKRMDDDASIDEAHAAFATGGFHIRPLIVALTQTKAFLSP